MKIPKLVAKLAMRHPRLIATTAAIPLLPICSQILPFWHEIESILAIILLFCILVVVDHKVEFGKSPATD